VSPPSGVVRGVLEARGVVGAAGSSWGLVRCSSACWAALLALSPAGSVCWLQPVRLGSPSRGLAEAEGQGVGALELPLGIVFPLLVADPLGPVARALRLFTVGFGGDSPPAWLLPRWSGSWGGVIGLWVVVAVAGVRLCVCGRLVVLALGVGWRGRLHEGGWWL